MNPVVAHVGTGAAALLAACLLTGVWTGGAASRLEESLAAPADEEPQVAMAAAADEGYCTRELKLILRRVLTSCGLVKKDRGRGCQPLEAKSVAAMSGGDFNALFHPLARRAAIVQFEKDKAELDDSDRALLQKTFSDQRGASYFLVVSRASPEGSVEHNRALSAARANAVLEYLKTNFPDPDLEQEVGLLWLGEEFAQLDEEFCTWRRSNAGPVAAGDGTAALPAEAPACSTADLNRSAFLAWIDCRL